MKNPNGYGSVVKLKGKRRKPYVVRKTIGWNDKGHPIYQTLGYTEKREEGLILLAQFNSDPWDVDYRKITLGELYELWVQIKAPKQSPGNRAYIQGAYNNHGKKLEKQKYLSLRAHHMQEIIDSSGLNGNSQRSIKSMFRHMDRFAHELGIDVKHYSQLLTTEPGPESSGKPFTEAEIKKLWKECDAPDTDAILMLIYTGFRIREFFALKLADISLAEGTIIGGNKTAAGRNRVVPIHAKIRPIVKRCVESNREYLIERSGEQWDYGSFIYNVWTPIMDTLTTHHTPHDTRHTFRTRLDNAGANKRCIDLLMGHKSTDIGERVYTHKTLKDLREALALVTS